jgi:hypothetical protein
MASKKRTIEHPKVKASGGGAEKGPITPPTIPEEQQARLATLLPAAHQTIQLVEDRMLALQIAATVRWEQNQSVHDVDEDAPPAFGDDEYAEFLDLVEDVARGAMFQSLASFFNLPAEVINQVMVSSLVTGLVGPPSANRKELGVVSHKRQGEHK